MSFVLEPWSPTFLSCCPLKAGKKMCVPKFNASGIDMYKYRYSVSDVSSGVADTQE